MRVGRFHPWPRNIVARSCAYAFGSMADESVFYRDEGDLLGSLIVHFEVLLQHRPGRIMVLKKFAVYRVHSITILYPAHINCTGNNIGEMHVSFLQAIQKIAHRLPQLQPKIGRDYSLTGNEATFRGEIESVTIKNAGAGRGTRGHISWPDRFAFAEVCSGDATEHDVIPIRETDDLDRPTAR